MDPVECAGGQRVQIRRRLEVGAEPLFVKRDELDWDPLVWFVGAHGGAGVTSLAHAIAAAGDAGRRWPAADRYPWCVVVSRSTLAGLEAAHDAVLQAKAGLAGGCQVLGLAVVADAPGGYSSVVEEKIRVLTKLTPNLWEIAYQPWWRDHLPSEIPSWDPHDPVPDAPVKKRGWRKGQHVDASAPVHPSVLCMGEAIVAEALALAELQAETQQHNHNVEEIEQ